LIQLFDNTHFNEKSYLYNEISTPLLWEEIANLQKISQINERSSEFKKRLFQKLLADENGVDMIEYEVNKN
jgi:hypothetical protein